MADPLTAAERADIAAALTGNPQNWHHFQDDIIPRYEATVQALEQRATRLAALEAAARAWVVDPVHGEDALWAAVAALPGAREG